MISPARTSRIIPCNTAPRSLIFLTWACCENGMDLASTPQMRTVRNAATRRLRRRSIGRLEVRLLRRYGISIAIETYRGHPKRVPKVTQDLWDAVRAEVSGI